MALYRLKHGELVKDGVTSVRGDVVELDADEALRLDPRGETLEPVTDTPPQEPLP